LDSLRAGAGHPSPLRNAVIAFTGILEGPLTPADGDALWRQYQVPVFEQFLGMDGELLAWECEIHHGLHVREEAALFECGDQDRLLVSFLANPRLPLLRLETGLTGRLVHDSCPCGEAAPRLVDVRRRTVRRATTAGAIAVAAVS
jgi:phenylacetate-coenzyme A ligase PaaK-like adenylate-forming protein